MGLTNKVRWEWPCPGLTGISRSTKKKGPDGLWVKRIFGWKWKFGEGRENLDCESRDIFLFLYNYFAVHHHQSSDQVVICRLIYLSPSLSLYLFLSLPPFAPMEMGKEGRRKERKMKTALRGLVAITTFGDERTRWTLHKFILKKSLSFPWLATSYTSIGQASGPAIARTQKRGDITKFAGDILFPFLSASRREKTEREKKKSPAQIISDTREKGEGSFPILSEIYVFYFATQSKNQIHRCKQKYPGRKKKKAPFPYVPSYLP